MYSAKRNLWVSLVIIVLSLGLSGCGTQTASNAPGSEQGTKAAEASANAFAVLQQESDKYLKQNKPLVVGPQEIYEKVLLGGDQSYYIVDVRSNEHYAKAHISGAINIQYADSWREDKIKYLPKEKKIIVVDYSGHTSSQVAAFWGMLGYDAVAMKNGMSGWSKNKDIIGGSPLVCSPFDYPVVAGNVEARSHELPALEEKVAGAAELLRKRGEMVINKPVVIQPKDLKDKMGTEGAPYLVDLRQPEHYKAGHIDGAVSIPFRSIAETDSLKKIPTNKQIVLVCYDGHAASQAARILNQLGYDATALKDGMSAWTANEQVSGIKAIACANIRENPTMKLNAVLKAGGGGAAT